MKVIAENASAAAVANVAGVTFATTPHLPGRQMQALILAEGIAAAGAVKIQGTDDDASVADAAAVWTDLGTAALAIGDASKLVTFQATGRVRLAVTTACGAGSKVSAYAVVQ